MQRKGVLFLKFMAVVLLYFIGGGVAIYVFPSSIVRSETILGVICLLFIATCFVYMLFVDNEKVAMQRLLRRKTRELRYSEAQNTLILESIAEGAFGVDKKGRITFLNTAARKLLGYEDELVGQSMHDFIHHSHRDGSQYDVSECPVHMTIDTGLSYQVHDEVFWTKDKKAFPVEYNSQPLVKEGRIRGAVVTFSDITERQKSEDLLYHYAHFDELTNLPNRAFFIRTLRHEVLRAKRSKEKIALLYFDVDGFKNINDSLGHPVGDALLVDLVSRVSHAARETDFFARLGGDEFVVLCSDLKSYENAINLSNRILTTCAKPFEVSEHKLTVSVSIGIAVYPNAGEEAELLLKNSDIALYKAKALGKNNYQFFTESLNKESEQKNLVEQKIKEGDLENLFHLNYQPLIDIKRGKTFGIEALLRTNDEELSKIGIESLITIAEERGLIAELGEFVLKEVAKQMSRWSESRPDIKFFVNVSVGQFTSAFSELLAMVLEQYSINPDSLVIEMTETAFVKNTKQTFSVLDQVKELGVGLALDDFGTGYASISYLQQLPIDYIKIDKSYVQSILTDKKSRGLSKAILELSNLLDINVVAEGVETAEQEKVVTELGYDIAQGYYYCRPHPANEVAKFIDKA